MSCGTTICFEDVLSRSASLQSGDVSHPKLFEVRLHRKFEDTIGINKSNWKRVLELGFEVVMVIDISNIHSWTIHPCISTSEIHHQRLTCQSAVGVALPGPCSAPGLARRRLKSKAARGTFRGVLEGQAAHF